MIFASWPLHPEDQDLTWMWAKARQKGREHVPSQSLPMPSFQALRERHTCRAFDTSQDVSWELVWSLVGDGQFGTLRRQHTAMGTSMWRGMECWEGTSAVEIFCFCWMLCIGLVWGTFAIFGPVGEDFESRPTLDCIGVLWRVFFKSKVVYSAQADVTCLRWWLVPA